MLKLLFDPETLQILGAQGVGGEGVEPLLLQAVRADLVPEPDPAPLLPEVEQHAAIGAPEPLEGHLELVAAVALERAEDLAGEALGVDPHQDAAVATPVAGPRNLPHAPRARSDGG